MSDLISVVMAECFSIDNFWQSVIFNSPQLNDSLGNSWQFYASGRNYGAPENTESQHNTWTNASAGNHIASENTESQYLSWMNIPGPVDRCSV